MPYDKTNKRLYVDRSVTPNKGITPDEVAQCIKDFRKTRFGRDVGILATSPNVNKLARHKPLRYPERFINMDDPTVAQRFNQGIDYAGNIGGMQTDKVKPTASGLYGMMSSPNFKILEYMRQDGVNFPCRIVPDFDGYCHEISYAITGKQPFLVEMTTENPKVGGKISLHITMGVAENQGDALTPEEVMSVFGRYAGLLFVRPNGDSTLNNAYQMAGSDWLVVTTQNQLTSYTVGGLNQEDSNGFATIHRPDSYHYTIDFKIPAKADLNNTAAGFDDFVGENISVYPIISDEYIAFLDYGDSTINVTKLAVSNALFKPMQFELEDENYDVGYVPPLITLDFNLAKSTAQGKLVISQLAATVQARHNATVAYSVVVNSVAYTVEYLAATENGVNIWQPDFGNDMSGGSIAWGGGVIIMPNTTRTITKTDGGEYPYKNKDKTLRVSAYVYATVTYNGITKNVIGKTTQKTI